MLLIIIYLERIYSIYNTLKNIIFIIKPNFEHGIITLLQSRFSFRISTDVFCSIHTLLNLSKKTILHINNGVHIHDYKSSGDNEKLSLCG